MKSRILFCVWVFVLFTGCVSISKYNAAVSANSQQRVTIEKLNKKLKQLEHKYEELKDSLVLYKGITAGESRKDAEVQRKKVSGGESRKDAEAQRKKVSGGESRKEAEAQRSVVIANDEEKRRQTGVKKDAGVELSNDTFQNEEEKAVLYYMNYARVKPQVFLNKYVLPHLRDTTQFYERTLIATLRKLKPVEPLKASSMLHGLAYCHAKASGESGYVGHGRDKEECNQKGSYNGECCAYGHASYASDEALNYVLQLLVDDGVPSLGHREIILMGWLKTAGVSIQPHITYGENLVIDFSAGN